jgi:hypothetical protein
MSGLADIRGAIDELGTAHKQFQQRHDQRLDALKQENDDLRSRLEELESRQKSVKTTANREQREHVALFTKWMRRPHDRQQKPNSPNSRASRSTLAPVPKAHSPCPRKSRATSDGLNFCSAPCAAW